MKFSLRILQLTIAILIQIHGLVSTKITEESFWDDCPNDTVCYFLSAMSKIGDPKHIEVLPNSTDCKKNPGSFCMRLNMKRQDGKECEHAFEMAAVNVESVYSWIGISISADNQMLNDYAFYCMKDVSSTGIINTRGGDLVQPVLKVMPDKDKNNHHKYWNWRPSPKKMKTTFLLMKDQGQGKYFISCGFYTEREYQTDAKFFLLNLGTGPLTRSKSNPDYYLMMAAGSKESEHNSNLYPSDKHSFRGLSGVALKNLKASNPDICMGCAVLMGSGHLMIVGLICTYLNIFYG